MFGLTGGIRRFMALLLVVTSFNTAAPAQEKSADVAPAVDVNGKAIAASGRPEVENLKDATARFVVWTDTEGWHVRTTSLQGKPAKFSGEVRLDEATFTKLRPVGLEPKSKNPDRWELSTDRSSIRFEIVTGGSFDGFDFEINSPKAVICFDLNVGGKPQPKRIFIGKLLANPTSATFSLSKAEDVEVTKD